MTLEDNETQTLIEAMFGPKVWDYTIVMFIHGDRLEGGKSINVISESYANLRNHIRKCRGGFHLFDNMNHRSQQQVTEFLIKIETLVALNGGDFYCTSCYPMRERRIRVQQEHILPEKMLPAPRSPVLCFILPPVSATFRMPLLISTFLSSSSISTDALPSIMSLLMAFEAGSGVFMVVWP
ncbi:unnamed protein product [Arctogadus glacialis]